MGFQHFQPGINFAKREPRCSPESCERSIEIKHRPLSSFVRVVVCPSEAPGKHGLKCPARACALSPRGIVDSQSWVLAPHASRTPELRTSVCGPCEAAGRRLGWGFDEQESPWATRWTEVPVELVVCRKQIYDLQSGGLACSPDGKPAAEEVAE